MHCFESQSVKLCDHIPHVGPLVAALVNTPTSQLSQLPLWLTPGVQFLLDDWQVTGVRESVRAHLQH